MKNRILITITMLANVAFAAGAYYLLDEKNYGANDRFWQVALTALLASTAWICLFICANPRHVERFFKGIIGKGERVYGWLRREIKRVHKRTSGKGKQQASLCGRRK